jgi:glycine/D-amino acid oxidase-like deaminating enzyme
MTRSTAKGLRRGQPIWLRGRDQRRARYPKLSGTHEAEVVIIGGGVTGALVALTFATAGVRVALIEGETVGRGSTAASSALILPDPDQGIHRLTERYGRIAGRRIWHLSHEAVREFLATLRQHRISCELVERQVVHFATDPNAADRLRVEYLQRKAAGFACDWLTPDKLRRLTGIAGAGAIRSNGSAQVNPYRACVGVMRAAASAGARIYERSPVTRIASRGNHVRVSTSRGRIEAARVIVATGYATARFRPLAGRFRMYRTYVLATRRLTVRQRRKLGLGPLLIWDTERPYHYARWTSDHRLLLGGGDRPVRAGHRRAVQFASATRELRGDFERLLPSLANVSIDAAWEGLFALTPDSLPYVGPHRRYPRHLFALGYGGNGMTFASLAARLLLEYWTGALSGDERLFRFGRLR